MIFAFRIEQSGLDHTSTAFELGVMPWRPSTSYLYVVWDNKGHFPCGSQLFETASRARVKYTRLRMKSVRIFAPFAWRSLCVRESSAHRRRTIVHTNRCSPATPEMMKMYRGRLLGCSDGFGPVVVAWSLMRDNSEKRLEVDRVLVELCL